MPFYVSNEDPFLRSRLTKLFANRNIAQRSVSYDQAFCVSLPHNVLVLGGMVEHGSQTQNDGLRLSIVAGRVYDRPITANEVNTRCLPRAQNDPYYV